MTIIFKKDSDASNFASKLREAHDKTQICYKYEKDCEIDFWWEHQTDMCSDERIDEDDRKRETINALFDYLESNNIAYKMK
ncbi:MAG TPA: hypothetical protein ENK06_00115 [Gammaproteobacteria bacterium]|nr:hypothetical protein [Gammaproteobacteria bacterium]